jgi:hypothetical protein
VLAGRKNRSFFVVSSLPSAIACPILTSMKTPNADQQEVIADTLEWLADEYQDGRNPSVRSIKKWVAYLVDEATANDPVILDGIYEGLTSKQTK